MVSSLDILLNFIGYDSRGKELSINGTLKSLLIDAPNTLLREEDKKWVDPSVKAIEFHKDYGTITFYLEYPVPIDSSNSAEIVLYDTKTGEVSFPKTVPSDNRWLLKRRFTKKEHPGKFGYLNFLYNKFLDSKVYRESGIGIPKDVNLKLVRISFNYGGYLIDILFDKVITGEKGPAVGYRIEYPQNLDFVKARIYRIRPSVVAKRYRMLYK